MLGNDVVRGLLPIATQSGGSAVGEAAQHLGMMEIEATVWDDLDEETRCEIEREENERRKPRKRPRWWPPKSRNEKA